MSIIAVNDPANICEGCINRNVERHIPCVDFIDNMEHNGLPNCNIGRVIYVEETEDVHKS